MKNYTALLLRILLTLLVIYSVGAFLATGKNYVGKDFFDSADYSEAERKFLSGIEYYILNPSDQQASIDAIDVTADEIAYYRNYYGSEVEQKYSIQKQYEGKIAEAREIHYRLLPFFKAAFVDGNPTSIKYAMNYKGLPDGGLRLPLVEVTDNAKKIIEDALKQCNL